MKLPLYISLCLSLTLTLCLQNIVTGLPFRTRGKGSSSTEAEGEELKKEGYVADAVIENGEVADIHVSTSVPGSRRNAIVESFFGLGDEDSSLALKYDIRERSADIFDFLVFTRRALHRHPELMYNEKQTSAYVQNVLRELDIPFTTGWAVNTVPDRIPGPGGFGIVADIGSGEPCVLLRADMDALPILERTEGVDEFKSTNEGKMHACGHDGHTTMLLGAASLLKEMEESINGTVRLMFQPAEEGGAGGKRMREEGVLSQDPKPKQAFGMHVWPT